MPKTPLVLLQLLLWGCWLAAAHDWPVASPEEHGLEARLLEELAAESRSGREGRDLHALLVVRNGQLVFEEYLDGEANPDPPATWAGRRSPGLAGAAPPSS